MSEREIIMKKGWKRNRGKRMMKLQKDACREVRNSCKKTTSANTRIETAMLGKIGANEEATKMQMRSKRNTGKEIQTKGKYEVHVAIDKNATRIIEQKET